MRVLVALGTANGKVLSRDDLIEACWDGVIVGDNAINQVISRLRHVLGELAHDAVRLETITKAGFRLVCEQSAVNGSALSSLETFDVPLVGVLPIVHRGGNDRIDAVASELTYHITLELAQNSLFSVIAAGTMAAWHGRSVDHRELGRELGVSYLIEGQLLWTEKSVRLTSHLIDAHAGSMVRSTPAATDMTEDFVVNGAFPATIAAELDERIARYEANRALTKHGQLSAWDHAMRAMALIERMGVDSIGQALVEARLAVAGAPEMGLAHALLARIIGPASIRERQEVGEAQRREIYEHVHKAMQFDGNNPVILHYAALAYANLGDGETSLRLAGRAVELAPHSPRSHCAMGQALHRAGRFGEAIVAFREQIRLAPYDQNRAHALSMLGVCLYIETRLDEAEDVLDQALALHPDSGTALTWKVLAAAQQGREHDAREALMRLRASEPEMFIERNLAVMAMLLRERAAEPIAIMRRLWDEAKEHDDNA